MARARLQYTTSTLSLAHSQVLSTSSKPFWMIAGRIGDSVKGLRPSSAGKRPCSSRPRPSHRFATLYISVHKCTERAIRSYKHDWHALEEPFSLFGRKRIGPRALQQMLDHRST